MANQRAWRVLVVDDDEMFQEALTALLESDGRFDVVAKARGGREGVKLARSLSPDVVLMDIDMPGMDGVEATRRIHESQPDIPIVVVSGSIHSDKAGEAEQAGARAYVDKSRAVSELIETVVAVAP